MLPAVLNTVAEMNITVPPIMFYVESGHRQSMSQRHDILCMTHYVPPWYKFVSAASHSGYER